MVNHEGVNFFVTAHHVIESLNLIKSAYGFFLEKPIDLSKLNLKGDKNEDVVVAHLDSEWAISKDIEKVRCIPFSLKDRTQFKETGYYFFLGYPASKNKTMRIPKKPNRFIYSYTLKEKLIKSKNTSIKNHLAFQFDLNSFIDSQEKKLRPPHPRGMSGGPLFSVLKRETKNGARYGVNLVGIFSEYYSNEKEAVFTDKSEILFCMNAWKQ